MDLTPFIDTLTLFLTLALSPNLSPNPTPNPSPSPNTFNADRIIAAIFATIFESTRNVRALVAWLDA